MKRSVIEKKLENIRTNGPSGRFEVIPENEGIDCLNNYNPISVLNTRLDRSAKLNNYNVIIEGYIQELFYMGVVFRTYTNMPISEL